MQLGTLSTIWRYPVKSMAPQQLETVEVDEDGVRGDRASALRIEGGPHREGKLYRGKEDSELHLQPTPQAAIDRANVRGYELQQIEGDRYFDDAPISLVLDRWLDGVSQFVGYAVEAQRFRPNFFVQAEGAATPSEPDLVGRMLGVGEVRLRVRYPIERCVVTTYDPATGESDPRVLRYIAQARSAWMGVYCDVLRAGIVRAGDRVEVVES